MRWAMEEEYLVGRFYFGHKSDWERSIPMALETLRDNGFEREESSVRAKLFNFQSLEIGGGLNHASSQTKTVFLRLSSLLDKGYKREEINQYVRSHYKESSANSLAPQNSIFEPSCNYFLYTGPREKPFFDTVVIFMDKKGITKDSDLYNEALINRGVFSDWRCGRKRPSRDNVIRLCFALGLKLNDANTLMMSAGYILSTSIERDCYIIYGLEQGWDLVWVDEELRNHKFPGLISNDLA